MRNEQELIEAIKHLDPFQNPTDNLPVERSVINQLDWCPKTTEIKVDDATRALIAYWQDVGINLIRLLNHKKGIQ